MQDQHELGNMQASCLTSAYLDGPVWKLLVPVCYTIPAHISCYHSIISFSVTILMQQLSFVAVALLNTKDAYCWRLLCESSKFLPAYESFCSAGTTPPTSCLTKVSYYEMYQNTVNHSCMWKHCIAHLHKDVPYTTGKGSRCVANL